MLRTCQSHVENYDYDFKLGPLLLWILPLLGFTLHLSTLGSWWVWVLHFLFQIKSCFCYNKSWSTILNITSSSYSWIDLSKDIEAKMNVECWVSMKKVNIRVFNHIYVFFASKKVMKVVVSCSSHEILFLKHGIHYLSQ
jgi:hypothetical protein